MWREKRGCDIHMGRNTPVLSQVTKESKCYSTREMVIKHVTAWVVRMGWLDVPRQDNQATIHPKTPKSQQSSLLRLFEEVAVMK